MCKVSRIHKKPDLVRKRSPILKRREPASQNSEVSWKEQTPKSSNIRGGVFTIAGKSADESGGDNFEHAVFHVLFSLLSG